MRFGISEISWMLPKILRIRRCFVLAPPEVLRGASIALVAMCFPALGGAHESAPRESCRYPGCFVERCPATLSNAFGPCAVRTLSRRGREKPRAHETVRRSRLFLGWSRYNPISPLVKGLVRISRKEPGARDFPPKRRSETDAVRVAPSAVRR